MFMDSGAVSPQQVKARECMPVRCVGGGEEGGQFGGPIGVSGVVALRTDVWALRAKV